MTTRLSLIHTLSPLHAGTGQAVGAIDLPIARERPTGIPLLPGSSIKGALRARITDPKWQTQLFGPDTKNASEHAGAVHFADAHLLLLPVRSLWGTFAWVTSPYLVMRFIRDIKESGGTANAQAGHFTKFALDTCLIAPRSVLTAEHEHEHEHKHKHKVVLEDLDLKAKAAGPLMESLSQATKSLDIDLSPRICIVHDDVMSTLMETSTEVRARIRLSETNKTVEKGALWYEESLPTESVLFGLVLANDAPARHGAPKRRACDLLDHISQTIGDTYLQLGGKASVGRGLCRLRLIGGAS